MTGFKKYLISESNISSNIVKPNDIMGPLTIGEFENSGEQCIIIGKPFTNNSDDNYIVAKELIKKLNYKIDNDLEDSYKEMGERANDVEYWVFVISNNVAICVEYAENGGVVVYK